MLEVQVVLRFRDAFICLDPFVAGGKGVESPMDEHAETVLREPGRISGGFPGDIRAHEGILSAAQRRQTIMQESICDVRMVLSTV